MTTVIIYTCDSGLFLDYNIKQIEKYQKVPTKIIIANQGEYEEIECDYQVVKIPKKKSGYSIDFLFNNGYIDTEHVCTLDVDCWPVHEDWLYRPLQMMDKYHHVGLRIKHVPETYGDSFIMAMCYRVSRSEHMKMLCKEFGFAGRNDENGWFDEGCWAHINEKASKYCFPITKYAGIVPGESLYGVLVSDLMFHFCNSSNAKGKGIEWTGHEYVKLMDRIKDGITDEVIGEVMGNLMPYADDSNSYYKNTPSEYLI